MKHSIIFLILLIYPPFLQAKNLTLSTGESVLLNVPKHVAIHIGHKDILSVKDLGTKIQVTAKKLGSSHVQYNNEVIQIQVLHKNIYQIFKELQKKLSRAQGLKLRAEKSNCKIFGELLSLRDWLDIYKIQKNYQYTCKFTAEIHPLIKNQVFQFWSNYLKKENLKALDISGQSKIQLTSSQLSKNELADLQEKINPWGLEIKAIASVKPRPPLVQVKLLLAEVSKSHSQSFGFDWTQNFQAKLLPGKDILGSWLVELNALESEGKGKVLAAPTLVAESGSKAEFLAGGEFPIRTKGYRSSKVQWKKHGLLFKIQPEVDSSSRIFLKIESEVSMLDNSSAVEGIPGLKVSRLNSQFNLKNGETVALSGLIQQRFGTQDSGVSFLKNLPILGELFKSTNYQNEKTELVVFVQPQILQQSSKPNFPANELLDEKYRGN